MLKWQGCLLLILMLGLSRWAGATVTDATPVNVGLPNQVFEAGSTYNIVMHIPIATDGGGGTFLGVTITNSFTGMDASEDNDIVANSARLWYMPVDTGLNTGTATLLTTLHYWRGYGYWSNSTASSQAVANGSALYVTVDIKNTPDPNNACAFQIDDSFKLFFSSASFAWSNPAEPASPPIIYLSTYHPASQIEISHQAMGPTLVSTGQTFTPLQFSIHNPNLDYPASNAPAGLTGITLTVKNASGALIAPNTVLDKIDLLVQDWKNNLWLFSLASPNIPTTPGAFFVPMNVAFDSDADPSKNLLIETRMTVCGNTATAASNFRLELSGPQNVAAMDALAFRPVAINAGTGDSFAMQSNLIQVEQGAKQLLVYSTATLPENQVVVRGQTNVTPMLLTFTHPGNSLTARIDITQMTLAVLDKDGNTLNPASVFSRIAITGGVSYGETTSIPTSGYLITIPMSHSNISIAYQPVTVSVVADILPNATAVNFKLSLAGPVAVRAQDANSQTSILVSPLTGHAFPMTTNTIRLASSFLLTGNSIAPATLYPNQRIGLLQLTFAHPGPANLGTISLRGLTITAFSQTDQPVSLAENLAGFYIHDGAGVALMQTTTLPAGNAIYLALPNVAVAPLTSMSLQIEIRLVNAPRTTTLKLGIMASTQVDATLPLDPTRPVFVTGNFPIMSQSAAMGGGEGQLRVANYPNPFAAGRTSTRIAFYLEQSCNVSAVLYTLAGDQVRALRHGEFQLPGEHVLDWDGRTASGAVVVNGVYLLRLEAIPTAAGDPIVQLRKIAVVK